MAKLEVSGIDEIIVFVMIIASHDELLFNQSRYRSPTRTRNELFKIKMIHTKI